MFELWDNPLFDVETRLQIAVGAIANLREQLNRKPQPDQPAAIQACREEDRAMLQTEAGKELLSRVVEEMQDDQSACPGCGNKERNAKTRFLTCGCPPPLNPQARAEYIRKINQRLRDISGELLAQVRAEPVADELPAFWMHNITGTVITNDSFTYSKSDGQWKPLYTHPAPLKKPQAQADPVAWMTADGRVASESTKNQMPTASREALNIPLYTHPAPREAVPVITSEQLWKLYDECCELKQYRGHQEKELDFSKFIGRLRELLAAAPSHGGEQ
jgi:hypothetical protein